jgi:hypothetical protein
MLFSERKGLSSVRDAIQNDGMDDELRSGLWNAFLRYIYGNIKYDKQKHSFLVNSNLYGLFSSYWLDLFKLPLDCLPTKYANEALKILREHFFECSWFKVYDFIEFTAKNCPDWLNENYTKYCNNILERERSAYRFVDSYITDIISDEEIEAIETAINSTTKYQGISDHIKTSIRLLYDHDSPDYRNSIKESISAVESLCISVSGDKKSTLGAALKKIDNSHQLHPAFKSALNSLYGYTSDSSGIRHALIDDTNFVSHSDAKFMLVVCSAFINYVLEKVSESK